MRRSPQSEAIHSIKHISLTTNISLTRILFSNTSNMLGDFSYGCGCYEQNHCDQYGPFTLQQCKKHCIHARLKY